MGDVRPIDALQTTGRNPLRVRASRPKRFMGKSLPERQWIVEDLIPAGTVTMIAGDGGLGKSLLAMMLQVACATGGTWLGRQAAPIKSVALYGEDDNDEIHRRMSDITSHYGIGFDDPRLDALQFNSVIGEENNMVDFATVFEKDTGERRNIWRNTDVWSNIYDWAVEEEAQLVILDSLHDYFHGNENDRAQVRFFVNQLRVIAQDINGAVVLLSHPSVAGMASGSGSSGSTAWNNAVRSRLYLTRPKADDEDDADPDVRVLKTMKANYGRIGDQIAMRWVDGVFVPENPNQGGGTVENIQKRSIEKAVLDGLRILAEQGRSSSDARSASNYAPSLLKNIPCCRGYSLKQLTTAMQSLLGAGTIGKVKIGYAPNRHPIIGLAEMTAERCAEAHD